MPGIIGYNVIGASSSNDNGRWANIEPTNVYNAVAGDVVDQIFFYGDNNGAGSKSVPVAIYTVVGGFAINRVNIPIGITVDDPASKWWNTASGLGISLTAGVDYCVAIDNDDRCLYYKDVLGNDTDLGNMPTLQDPWVHWVFQNYRISAYANVIAGGGGSVSPCILIEDYDEINIQ